MKQRGNTSLLLLSSGLRLSLSAVIFFYTVNIFAQHRGKERNDTTDLTKTYAYLDSLKPLVSEIKLTGNEITDDEIILREMETKRGDVFSSRILSEDENRIKNLGIFSNAEIKPELSDNNKVRVNVNVKEKWYIYPMPSAGTVDGDIHKLWVGASVRWQNFRGRNENVMMNFGVGYNPFIHASYSIPWIGRNEHFFASLSGGYSKDRNRSRLALGLDNGNTYYGRRDDLLNNFDYYNYNIKITLGKYISRNFSLYAEGGFTMLKVSDYEAKRTVSQDGTDRYALFGAGINYDSRNNHEFTTSGYQMHLSMEHYGMFSSTVNFGRVDFTQQGFVPVRLSGNYFVIMTSRLNTSLAGGTVIPYYNHKFLGYGSDVIRGWYWYGFEGDNLLTVNNEIRFPIIIPGNINGSDLPVVKKIKYLKSYSYKYGLYATMFYDAGTVWDKGVPLGNLHFLNGAGFGLNGILPFGLSAKMEYGFRLSSPVIGQVIFGLGGRF
ncbi:MAG: BamA/TamA family outer membrane protein [Bacteroidetes bacterium]|nr:BamA/TamA family outer membrane protein [Bacteroidota bacterium]